MVDIFKDIATAARTFGAIRKARKAGTGGAEVKVRLTYTVPLIEFGPAYQNTIEGCQTWKCGRETDRAVAKVFYSLPYEVQRQLEFTPKNPGEWAARARFWQEHLKPNLPPEMYHAAMLKITHWFAHCVRMRLEAVQA